MREVAGISLKDIAARIGIDPENGKSLLSRYERGAKPLSEEMLLRYLRDGLDLPTSVASKLSAQLRIKEIAVKHQLPVSFPQNEEPQR